jgi:hypothetical protein
MRVTTTAHSDLEVTIAPHPTLIVVHKTSSPAAAPDTETTAYYLSLARPLRALRAPTRLPPPPPHPIHGQMKTP